MVNFSPPAFNLQNGQVADASQVMANINQIIDNGNANVAASGSNSDITSINGLTTPLSAAQGGSTVYVGGSSTGTNSIVISTLVPIGYVLTSGNIVSFIAGGSCSGASTLNANSTGVLSVKKRGRAGYIDTVTGDIVSGLIYNFEYDGTYHVLLNPSLGTMAFENSNAVTITGGTVTGISLSSLSAALAIADGGTAAITAAAGFDNLKQAATTSYAGVVQLATSSIIKTGTDSTAALVASALLAALGFSGYFSSADQTVTAGGSLTIAHGLGRIPIFAWLVLKCATGEFGYTAGDLVFWDGMHPIGGVSAGEGVAIVPDATNLNIRYGNDIPLYALRKDTGAVASLTSANWKTIFRCFG